MSKIAFQVVGTIAAVAVGSAIGSAATAATENRPAKVIVTNIGNEGSSGEVR